MQRNIVRSAHTSRNVQPATVNAGPIEAPLKVNARYLVEYEETGGLWQEIPRLFNTHAQAEAAGLLQCHGDKQKMRISAWRCAATNVTVATEQGKLVQVTEPLNDTPTKATQLSEKQIVHTATLYPNKPHSGPPRCPYLLEYHRYWMEEGEWGVSSRFETQEDALKAAAEYTDDRMMRISILENSEWRVVEMIQPKVKTQPRSRGHVWLHTPKPKG